MSYKVDGVAITPATVSATYVTTLTVSGATTAPSESLSLSIPAVTALGTFTTGTVIYSEGTSATTYADTVSSIVITELTTTTTTTSNKVSGTFTAGFQPFLGGAGSKSITNGTFTNVSY